jgi:uncharacterized lipoprotein YajG
MVYVACLLVVALLLAGCAWPSRTQPWCLPKAKYQQETHGVFVGVRCDW